MLKKLIVENFKPFKGRHEIKLAPITLIYGPNSGGKSSLIQSILLLKQTLNKRYDERLKLTTKGEYVDVGSYKTLIYKHDLSLPLNIGFTLDEEEEYGLILGFKFDDSDDELESGKTIEVEKIEYILKNTKGNCSIQFKRSKNETNNKNAFIWDTENDYNRFVNEWAYVSDMKSQFILKNPDGQPNKNATEKHFRTVLENLKTARLVSYSYRLPFSFVNANEDEDLVLDFDNPSETGEKIKEIVSDSYNSLRRLSYIGPSRNKPMRFYENIEGQITSVGVEGENCANVIFNKSKKVCRVINKNLADLKVNYDVKIKMFSDDVFGNLIRLSLRDRTNKIELSATDVGYGISQVLPIVVEGTTSFRKTIVVEQPELHLHPKLQGELMDFFIKTSTTTELLSYEDMDGAFLDLEELYKNQWIIETHSETMMLRLQKRIRQGLLKKEQVSVLYVNPIHGEGAEILELRLDEKGDFLDEWPHGFFDEDFYELFGE